MVYLFNWVLCNNLKGIYYFYVFVIDGSIVFLFFLVFINRGFFLGVFVSLCLFFIFLYLVMLVS